MLDILNKINQPEDLRNIEINDLEKLSEEIREVLLQKLSKNGGHFGPNFGMVEAIIAMHYVFAGGCYSAALGSVVYGPHAGCFFKRNH